VLLNTVASFLMSTTNKLLDVGAFCGLFFLLPDMDVSDVPPDHFFRFLGKTIREIDDLDSDDARIFIYAAFSEALGLKDDENKSRSFAFLLPIAFLICVGMIYRKFPGSDVSDARAVLKTIEFRKLPQVTDSLNKKKMMLVIQYIKLYTHLNAFGHEENEPISTSHATRQYLRVKKKPIEQAYIVESNKAIAKILVEMLIFNSTWYLNKTGKFMATKKKIAKLADCLNISQVSIHTLRSVFVDERTMVEATSKLLCKDDVFSVVTLSKEETKTFSVNVFKMI